MVTTAGGIMRGDMEWNYRDPDDDSRSIEGDVISSRGSETDAITNKKQGSIRESCIG